MLNLFYLRRNFNKLSINYQSHPKSTKLDVFEQKICNVTALVIQILQKKTELKCHHTANINFLSNIQSMSYLFVLNSNISLNKLSRNGNQLLFFNYSKLHFFTRALSCH